MTAIGASLTPISIPFFRPSLTDAEIEEVTDTLRSGWLTTGPKVRRFESDFAVAVCAKNAVAVNSCTTALHLALEALDLKPGQAVLVPTMTFAATAAVVRYQGAIPLLVDCDPRTLNLDLQDAAAKLEDLRSGKLPSSIQPDSPVVGIIPVHVGGLMIDMRAIRSFSDRHGLWVVEDAAHAFPAAWRGTANDLWQRCGQGTADMSCFSFYANKTITTGEGGMVVSDNDALAERARMMSLHGLSHDAWGRYSNGGSWDYKISAPGYKYNLTDIAAAVGIHQLARSEEMRQQRQAIARCYREAFADLDEIELPPDDLNRIHSWHLFPLKLRLERLSINRNTFIDELKRAGIGCSVHWRPLHLHPYYRDTFGWRPEDLPIATAAWERLVSLPIFPAMRDHEIKYVILIVKGLCSRYGRRPV
jgi:perosamine synthetase